MAARMMGFASLRCDRARALLRRAIVTAVPLRADISHSTPHRFRVPYTSPTTKTLLGGQFHMITMLGSKRRSCDGITRRETLKAGALALFGGMNLPNLLAAQEAPRRARRPGRAKNVIMLYLLGGAATQDMIDLKPNAPEGVRSEFRPIATNVNGIQVCEHLPRMSRWMHKIAVVRSLNHKAGCHNTLPGYTGLEVIVPDNTTTRDTFPPSMGSVCEWLRQNSG